MNPSILTKERAFLDKVFHTYRFDVSPQSRAMQQLIVKTFAPYLRGGRGLELGCSDGFMTELLASKIERLDLVDGSRKFLRKASQRKLSNVNFIYSLFEEFTATGRYDYVFASCILEHVLDPVAVLQVARSALKST